MQQIGILLAPPESASAPASPRRPALICAQPSLGQSLSISLSYVIIKMSVENF